MTQEEKVEPAKKKEDSKEEPTPIVPKPIGRVKGTEFILKYETDDG